MTKKLVLLLGLILSASFAEAGAIRRAGKAIHHGAVAAGKVVAETAAVIYKIVW